MKELKCITIDGLDFNPKKMGDLIYYEGPLLSHFKDMDKPNDHYFYRWVDNDEDSNRWLIFKSTTESLLEFFGGTYSELDLILRNNVVTFIDLDDNLDKVGLYVTSLKDVPVDYLPAKNTFFDAVRYEPYALELKSQLEKPLNEEKVMITLLNRVLSLEKEHKETKKMLLDVRVLLQRFQSDKVNLVENLFIREQMGVYQDDLLNQLTEKKSYYNK